MANRGLPSEHTSQWNGHARKSRIGFPPRWARCPWSCSTLSLIPAAGVWSAIRLTGESTFSKYTETSIWPCISPIVLPN
jgi:hypothetical protein